MKSLRPAGAEETARQKKRGRDGRIERERRRRAVKKALSLAWFTLETLRMNSTFSHQRLNVYDGEMQKTTLQHALIKHVSV